MHHCMFHFVCDILALGWRLFCILFVRWLSVAAEVMLPMGESGRT